MPNTALQERFDRIFDEHGAAVHALLRRLCRRSQDADDLFQETAVRVWRALPEQNGLANPRGWLTTIAYRTFVDLARQSRRRRAVGLDDTPGGPADERGGPDAAAESREQQDRARAALEGLEQPIREVFVLHYSGGLTLRETGEAMGITEGTVKSRLNRGLRTLRRMLK